MMSVSANLATGGPTVRYRLNVLVYWTLLATAAPMGSWMLTALAVQL